jgi:hypothetical protein
MVNDNEEGTEAARPAPPFSLAQSVRTALLRASIYGNRLREVNFSQLREANLSQLRQANLASTLIVSRLRTWLLPFQAGWQRFLTPAPPEAGASAGASAPGGADELRGAIRAFRGALVAIGVATGLISLLSLAGPLFMLQVYDRVLPSRSLATLVGLALLVLVLVLFAFQGLLDMLRGRILLRVGRALDQRLSARVFEIVLRAPLEAKAAGSDRQSIRDLDNVRSFMSSSGLTAFFRPTLDAIVRGGVLSVSPAHGHRRPDRRHHRLLAHAAHGSIHAGSEPRLRSAGDVATQAGRGRPPQRGAAAGSRHAAAHDRAMARRKRRLSAHVAEGQ